MSASYEQALTCGFAAERMLSPSEHSFLTGGTRVGLLFRVRGALGGAS